MCSDILAKGYEPRDVEQRWYDFWEKERLFAASETSEQTAYSIVIPPPNVTRCPSHGPSLKYHPAGYPLPVSPAAEG